MQVKLQRNWRKSTAKFYLKILFNWANNLDLCPRIYQTRSKGFNKDEYMKITDFQNDIDN